MKLSELTVAGFGELLASDAPAPGGGSAAALTGALGSALTAMVANLTLGRRQYEQYAEFAAQARERADGLRQALLQVMERDTEAFNRVGAAFALPKGTPEEKAARSAAIQDALKGCTETPMEMMRLSLEGLCLTEELLERGYNPSSASDLGVAFLNLRAAMQGAWLNVLINLGSIKDPDFVTRYRAEGEQILARALPLAEEGYRKVLALVE